MFKFCYKIYSLCKIMLSPKNLVSKLSFEQIIGLFSLRSTVHSKHYIYGNYTLVCVTKTTVLQR